MYKKSNYTFLILLIAFSIYCALVVGESWDERSELLRGKITLDYFFSLGKIDKQIWFREFNSPIYYTFLYLLTTIFPSQYQIESSHLINLIFSLGAIFGIRALGKELFNEKVGNIAFVILFFYPIFFGHMAFNSKDTIIAFCHVWIVYLLFKYLKNQNIKEKIKNYIIFIAILTAIATGIKLVFLGSLIPVFLFMLAEIFYFKKIIYKNFIKKKLFYDALKCILISYLILIAFWIDVHPNILLLPLEIISKIISNINLAGWPYNLINGVYYDAYNVPVLYLLINLLFKSPEYILISYLFFLILFFTSIKFFKIHFKFFIYKLSFVIIILLFANMMVLIIPFPVYDGMRLFLWVLPYFCIIPSLTIYYLIENFRHIKSKVAFLFLSLFIIHFLYNFFSITPYQYTYLNLLNKKEEVRYERFENDYWGASIKELIKKTKFKSDKFINFATCGVEKSIAKNYLKKKDTEILPLRITIKQIM